MATTLTEINSDKATLSREEFCRKVGISLVTEWRLRQKGRISFCQVGDKILYLPRHVDEFLASMEKRARVRKQL